MFADIRPNDIRAAAAGIALCGHGGSTNVVINKADISYSDLHFAFAGTPTNSLELAFGIDVNTNGVLEAEESRRGLAGAAEGTSSRMR